MANSEVTKKCRQKNLESCFWIVLLAMLSILSDRQLRVAAGFQAADGLDSGECGGGNADGAADSESGGSVFDELSDDAESVMVNGQSMMSPFGRTVGHSIIQ